MTRRGVALVAAVILEILLALLILSLGEWETPPPETTTLVRFKATAVSDPAPPAEERPAAEATALERADIPAPIAVTRPVEPLPERPSVVLPDLPAFDLSNVRTPAAPPRAVSGPLIGPPDTGSASSDTARVGTAPNGEPLYAAAWYRKPYDDELKGYLSTASGPGWGLIACRTAPDFRVEDCVALQEYPQGSNINRAVMAAAWQFKVRPPRLGGRSLVGAWVRIRFDYEQRQ